MPRSDDQPSRINPAYRPPKPERIGPEPEPAVITEIPERPKNPALDAAIRDAYAPKPKPIRDKIMNAIFKKLLYAVRDFLLQIFWPFAIFEKDPDTGNPVLGPDGKPKIAWVQTIVTRLVALFVSLWGTVELLGRPVTEWGDVVLKLFGLS